MVLRTEFDGGTVAMTRARERGDINRQYQQRLQVTSSFIDRLGLEKELTGHFGCVNCLEWNTDGSVLASASDDLHVILWDPYRYKARHTLSTGHNGNIFSVKFLTPYLLATCAADSTVRIRDITTSTSQDTEGRVCCCHCSRVKRLAVAPDCPNLVWSAGEDGLILEHDIRTPHVCNSTSSNVLVNLLNHLGRFAEAKCLAINPRRPEQLAVGANDFYVRLYDRRMIKLSRLNNVHVDNQPPRDIGERQNHRLTRAGQGDLDNNIPRSCVQYFAPGHLATQQSETSLQKKATTYLTFSSDGNELLVNLGSEQVYLFDINSHRRPVLLESYIIEHNHGNKKNNPVSANGFSVSGNGEELKIDGDGKNGTIHQDADLSKDYVLPKRVKDLKEQANEEVHKNNYTVAVQLYNQAISLCPGCAVLYSNRAAALMRRKWAGDIYAAIRDCYTAINLDPHHVKSHFRLAKALMELKKAREAHECLLYFKDKFPKYTNAHAVWLLQKDINLAMTKLEAPGDEMEADETAYVPVSYLERQLRQSCVDYGHRYLGHCNTTTDIKEASFLGQDSQFIVAGSDDGCFFVWSRKTGNIVKCMKGDDSIVNCIQVHPTMCLIATSGIESTVRLWSPRPEDAKDPREVGNIPDAAQANQQRMRADPFEAMLLNITYQGGLGGRNREGGPGPRADSPDGAVSCRAS